jgi:hypothetical protein
LLLVCGKFVRDPSDKLVERGQPIVGQHRAEEGARLRVSLVHLVFRVRDLGLIMDDVVDELLKTLATLDIVYLAIKIMS